MTTLTRLPGMRFAGAVLVTALLALACPDPFRRWGDFELKVLIVPCVQTVMFGMGMRVSLRDFRQVAVTPWPVVFGLVLQYLTMPGLALGLAVLFRFPPEIAGGVVLIGSACAGASSNVMTFLAGGNLALSVTMTTLATMLSPVVTPALMKLLAGRVVTVSFTAMMWSIVRIVVLPVVAGLAAERLLRAHRPLVDRVLPPVVMMAVCLSNVIITANSRDALLATGLALLASELLHNLGGYAVGFGVARLAGMSPRDAITMAMQVGIRNGSMATGVAMDVLKSSNAALAPAVFGTLQNVSGAVVAALWRGRQEAANRPEKR